MQKNLNKYIYNDCLVYDRTTYYVEDYFNREPNRQINHHYPMDQFNNFNQSKVTDKEDSNEIKGDPLNIKRFDNAPEANDKQYIMKLRDNSVMSKSVVAKNNYLDNTLDKDKESNHQSEEDNKAVDLNLPITLKDYAFITEGERLKYDRRTFVEYIKDEIMTSHTLMSLFIKHSITDALLLRCIKLSFMLNMILSFNAFFYTDEVIDMNREYRQVYNI
jgi:hypothetical protein